MEITKCWKWEKGGIKSAHPKKEKNTRAGQGDEQGDERGEDEGRKYKLLTENDMTQRTLRKVQLAKRPTIMLAKRIDNGRTCDKDGE